MKNNCTFIIQHIKGIEKEIKKMEEEIKALKITLVYFKKLKQDLICNETL